MRDTDAIVDPEALIGGKITNAKVAVGHPVLVLNEVIASIGYKQRHARDRVADVALGVRPDPDPVTF